MQERQAWYQHDPARVIENLNTRVEGLHANEVAERRRIDGPNELVERDARGPWQILTEQFVEPMIWLLLVAAGVSLVIHEYLDALAVGVIVVLNAFLGFFQDYRAEKAMAALRQLAIPKVRTRRGGQEVVVSATELVVGDVILLHAGDRVPADCRVLISRQLQVQEAALTGESHAVVKDSASLQESTPSLGDRTNMLFMGTDVSAGRGEAIVVNTGMHTELGKIADLIQNVQRQRTPLQKRLARMGAWLAGAAVGIVAIVFILGVLRGQDLSLMLMTALSMAVAAVPEGLPAVATIALALGAKRMLARKALIRKLPAVETLGSVTVICSDKTGTLTENRMRLSTVRHGQHSWDLNRSARPTPFQDTSTLTDSDAGSEETNASSLDASLLIGTLCNDAKPTAQNLTAPDSPEPNSPPRTEIDGEPTEAAFVSAAHELGLLKDELEVSFPRVAEAPFDPERKRMATVHRLEPSTLSERLQSAYDALIGSAGSHLVLIKGAADRVVEVCSHSASGEGLVELDESEKSRLLKINDELAAAGKRVLGLAYRHLHGAPNDESASVLEQSCVFYGFAGLIDPPRAEAQAAVELCKSAGIRPLMITGDHPLTAQQIAGSVGIANAKSTTGQELDHHNDQELKELVETTSVYARVSPEHKLRIVQALQSNGHVVAMTGDGVNDAPALKKADIGVAMGITGTDVSKDAAEAVLLDDNFNTIVSSVEEGRIIYDNIRKFLKYTMTSNTGEVLVMLAAPFFGMPLPLVPLQILWVNLVTDGLPGLAMAVEPGERDTMRRPPRAPGEPIFTREIILHIMLVGACMGFISLAVGYCFWLGNPTEIYDSSWGTIVFTVLTLSQMGNALAVRSDHDSLFSVGLFSNRAMLGAVALTFVAQLAVVYVPFLQAVFQTQALSGGQLLLCLSLSTLIFWIVELEKWLKRRNASTLPR